MRVPFLLPLAFAGLNLLASQAPATTFRQWLGREEVGGETRETRREGGAVELRSREWLVLSRLGQEIRQDLTQTARKAPDGSLTFTWQLRLSEEPFEGRAEWRPATPKVLAIHPAHGPVLQKEVPPGAILWPDDLDERLRQAARSNAPLRVTTFSFPVQQWSTLELTPRGPAPLPGFPDAVRFTGEERQGAASAKVELWFSPTQGELRHISDLGGLEALSQRSELPPPTFKNSAGAGLFEQTLQPVPPHPFLPWIPELTLRADGPAVELPESAEQSRLGQGRWRMQRAAMPTPQEAAQLPVKGTPAPADARYLAPSALVPFQDPAFDGLLRRMALVPGLPRWQLARRVNRFVFEWITEKDYTVGFASALEVCRHPRGDCTEHGVLAVALLRRLGVPARGVTGWVALGDLLGLHFWVEVRLGDRWIPLDPTFDQAPASAFRIKLGDTDLADLGSVGWEGAALAFSGVKWIPEKVGAARWGSDLTLRGDLVTGAGGLSLRLPGATWRLNGGILEATPVRGSALRIQAVTRPGEAQLREARRLAGPRTLRMGWWVAGTRLLWMDLGDGRWLQVEGADEAGAFDLLDQLMAPASSS